LAISTFAANNPRNGVLAEVLLIYPRCVSSFPLMRNDSMADRYHSNRGQAE